MEFIRWVALRAAASDLQLSKSRPNQCDRPGLTHWGTLSHLILLPCLPSCLLALLREDVHTYLIYMVLLSSFLLHSYLSLIDMGSPHTVLVKSGCCGAHDVVVHCPGTSKKWLLLQAARYRRSNPGHRMQAGTSLGHQQNFMNFVKFV